MLVDNIQESIYKDEISKVCLCECCEKEQSCFIYLEKSGICTVICHVCDECGFQLNEKGYYENELIKKINV